jgi:hypothetical protein
MGRLIEFQPAEVRDFQLIINVGDVLVVGAFGVQVRSGADAVEVVGPLVQGVISDNDQLLSPLGAPNTLLIIARAPGRSVLNLKLGDPFHSPRNSVLNLEIRRE